MVEFQNGEIYPCSPRLWGLTDIANSVAKALRLFPTTVGINRMALH